MDPGSALRAVRDDDHDGIDQSESVLHKVLANAVPIGCEPAYSQHPMPIDKTKKNIFLLATCQAPFMTSTSAVFTTSALVGHMLAEAKSFATLPLAIQFAAGMVVTVPASLYMKRVGRQIGFITGAADRHRLRRDPVV